MIPFLIFMLGLAFGSFAGVLVTRSIKDESIIKPNSYCPKCNTPLKIWHNIPLLSFILLKGKCGICNKKIGVFYPLVEFLGGIIFLSVYFKVGLSFHFLFVSLTFIILLSMSFVDLKTKHAPDSLNLIAFCMAMLSAFFGSNSFFETPITPFLFLIRFQDAFVMSGFLLFLKFIVEFFLKKEALGEADILVVGTLGAMLGLKFAMIALFFAALFSILPSFFIKQQTGDEQMPFIPFLALGAFVVYLFGQNIDHFLKVMYAI